MNRPGLNAILISNGSKKKKLVFTTKNTKPIREVPLKRIYYNRFKYKLLLKPPLHMNSLKYSADKYSKTELRMIKREREEFDTIKNTLTGIYYANHNPLAWHLSWGGLRTHHYWFNVSLYFDDEVQFNEYASALRDWIIEIEKPLNDKHMQIYDVDHKINVEVKKTLYVRGQYKYKVILKPSRSEPNIEKCAETMKEIFSDRDDVYIKENDYSVTFHTNNEDDLMFVKLVSNGNFKINKAVLASEILE